MLVLCALATPALASADETPRIAVVQFEGPTKLAERARAAVISSLSDSVSLISLADWEQAKIDLPTPAPQSTEAEIYSALAAASGADAVIVGQISGRSKSRAIGLVIRASWDGEVIEARSIPLPHRYIGRGLRRAIGAEAAELLAVWRERAAQRRRGEAAGATAATAAADADARPEHRSGLTEVDGAGSRSSVGATARPDRLDASASELSDRASATPGSEQADRPDDRRFKRPPLRAGIHGSATLGWAFTARDLRFSLADDRTELAEPFRYERPPASSIAVAGEVFPLGSLDRRLADLGMTVAFDRTLGLRSELAADSGNSGQSFATVQQHWNVGLVYRIPFPVTTRPTNIVASVAFDRLRHHIDIDDPAVALPDVTYSSIDFGLGAQTAIAQSLSVGVNIGLFWVLDAGEIETMDNYGQSEVVGVDVELRAELTLLRAIQLRAGLRYLHISLDFDGPGQLRDLDQDGEVDVEAASDAYVGGHVQIGYVF
ncbi:MAG: hypothetical protein MJE77_20155 [Proteobacteria bacterium]|nr:hypothetical protein [Pseudomonadota bacterium]